MIKPIILEVQDNTQEIPLEIEEGANPAALAKKADKVKNAVSGNFAGLDEHGNLTDSGKKASDFATVEDLNAKYTKPEDGIPASDLASGVIPDTSGLIPAPVSASAGDFLVYNGTAWVAQSLSTWQGGNY